MAQIVVSKTYADGDILFEADLDAIKDSIETFLNVTKINDDNLQDQGIDGSTKLADLSVTSAKLAANAVTTSKLASNAVTADKLAANSVTTSKIIDEAVTAAKLADGSITTSKLEARAISTDGSDPGLGGISTNLISQTRTSTGDYTNTITLTVSGNSPVIVMLNRGAVVVSQTSSGTSTAANLEFRLADDSDIYTSSLGYSSGPAGFDITYPAGSFFTMWMPPSSGTVTFKVYTDIVSSNTSVALTGTPDGAVFLAMELL